MRLLRFAPPLSATARRSAFCFIQSAGADDWKDMRAMKVRNGAPARFNAIRWQHCFDSLGRYIVNKPLKVPLESALA